MQTRSFGDRRTRQGPCTNKCMNTIGTDPPRALGPAITSPHQQAAHMTAPDQRCRDVEKLLPIKGHPHTTQSRQPEGEIKKRHGSFKCDRLT